MNNTQRVTVELKNGKFRLTEGRKADDLNPKALVLYATAQCAELTIKGIILYHKEIILCCCTDPAEVRAAG